VKSNFHLEPFFFSNLIEAGCDEAGRGCLAGPVFAAAVILPKDFYHPYLNDSKQMSASKRDQLRPLIEKEAVAWGVAMVDNEEIDRINILNASIRAMHLALDSLRQAPEIILVDGNRFHQYRQVPHKCIVGGDARYAPVAAASVLAKTHRDEYIKTLSQEFPAYGWDRNMAYPTKYHREAILKWGSCKYHRNSFRLL